MISVLISSESRYPISRLKIRKKVEEVLREGGMDDVEVSILIAGERKVRELNKQYRKVDEPTDVLSFPLEEPRDSDGILSLGDVIVSYPLAQKYAMEENKLVDDEVLQLIEHGLRHLLGLTHEEGFDFKNDTVFKFKVPAAKN